MKTRHRPLAEQVVAITGASSGIGLATAISAAHHGARVALIARSGDTLEDIAAALRDEGALVEPIVADVSDRDAIERAVSHAVQRFGRIDTWVNNAGVAIFGKLEEVTDVDSRRLFDINFWGVVYGSLVALPHLRRSGGGALINVGSELSESVIPLQGMYASSKHAVKGFTDALRLEVELVDEDPVSVTLIQPTGVDTPYAEHARNYMAHEPKLPTPPIAPLDVAAAILDAAQNGGRDVKVGAIAHANLTLGKIAPRLFDRLAAGLAHRQQKSIPARNPEGTLYEGGGEGRINGR